MDQEMPSEPRRSRWGTGLAILIATGSLVWFAVFLFTLDPVFLIPATAGAVFVVTHLARRNMPAPTELARRQTAQATFLLMALLAAALGLASFLADGWTDSLLPNAGCVACFLCSALLLSRRSRESEKHGSPL